MAILPILRYCDSMAMSITFHFLRVALVTQAMLWKYGQTWLSKVLELKAPLMIIPR